jgi:type 1 glutamine amidotransferase
MPVRARSALVVTATVLTLSSSPAHAQKKNPQGTPVLLLTGGQREHHGYREQALYLSSLLEDTGRYRVTLCEDGAILETPAMNRYQILVVNADRRDPEFKFTKEQQHALLSYVKGGHGYVSIHGADNAPPDWLPEWKEMLGGVYSHVGKPDGKAIMGTYTIHIADKSGPVTQGLDDFVIKDELYSNMQMKDDVKPLATIDYQGVTWPVAWTYEYGKGKVFHTSLGHKGWKPGSDDPLKNPNLSKLIIQGVDWVTKGTSQGKSAAVSAKGN